MYAFRASETCKGRVHLEKRHPYACRLRTPLFFGGVGAFSGRPEGNSGSLQLVWGFEGPASKLVANENASKPRHHGSREGKLMLARFHQVQESLADCQPALQRRASLWPGERFQNLKVFHPLSFFPPFFTNLSVFGGGPEGFPPETLTPGSLPKVFGLSASSASSRTERRQFLVFV